MRFGIIFSLLFVALSTAWAADNHDAPPGTSTDDVERKMLGRRAAAEASGDHGALMEIDTQIARQQGLRGQFDKAKATLAQVAAGLRPEETAAHAQYELELGRLIRTQGDPAAAERHFQKALEIAQGAKHDGLAIDAAHMLVIIAADPAQQIARSRVAIGLVEKSANPGVKAWLSVLWNNLAATYGESHQYDEALDAYSKSRAACSNELCSRIADWKIARVHRERGDLAEALAMLEILGAAVVRDWPQDGTHLRRGRRN